MYLVLCNKHNQHLENLEGSEEGFWGSPFQEQLLIKQKLGYYYCVVYIDFGYYP